MWHSATGGLGDDERRVMHLVAYDGGEPPTAAGAAVGDAGLGAPAPPRGTPSVLGLLIGQTPRDDLLVPLRGAIDAAGGAKATAGAAAPIALVARGAAGLHRQSHVQIDAARE